VLVLLEAVNTQSGEYYFRHSDDNGKTWQRTEEEWVASESLAPTCNSIGACWGSGFDRTNCWLFRAYLENQDIPGIVSWDPQSPAVPTPRYSTGAG